METLKSEDKKWLGIFKWKMSNEDKNKKEVVQTLDSYLVIVNFDDFDFLN